MGQEKKLIFLDTETTTNDTERAHICQVAFKEMNQLASSKMFKPETPIELEAMAVTHITNKMVEYEEPFKDSVMQKHLQHIFHDEKAIIVAHNAEFDVKMLNKYDINPEHVICTMKVARHLDVEDKIPNYKMQYIRYAWEIEIAATAHDAKGDILVLEEIYKRLAAQLTVEQMLTITAQPFLLRKMSFGKYKGVAFKDVPKDYLIWLRRQENITGDLLYTLNYYINRGVVDAERKF